MTKNPISPEYVAQWRQDYPIPTKNNFPFALLLWHDRFNHFYTAVS